MMIRAGWKSIAVIALFALMVGCATEEDSITMAPLPSVQSQFTPVSVWQAKVGNGVYQYFSRLSPAFGYDKIFAADRDGVVQAMNAQTGELVWKIDLAKEKKALISGGLTTSYGKVFLGTETGNLIALHEETGDIAWQADVGGEILSKPLADEGLVIVNSSRGQLSAYDANTGEERWKISTDIPNLTLRGDSAPVAISGGVFWGMANGRLGAAFIANGNIIWQQALGMAKGATEIDRLVDVDSTPIISDSLLYAGGYNGQLVAIDLRSGRASWKRKYSTSNDFYVSGRYLFLVTDKDYVVAIDAQSGTELWQNKDLEYRQLTAPVVIDDKVVVADAEGYLHWLDQDTGEFIAQEKFNSSGIAIAPIKVDDDYVVISRDGQIARQKIP